MRGHSEAAWERAMKGQAVILWAMAKRITWWQAAETLGMTDRSMGRWKHRYEQRGYDGLFDRRRGRTKTSSILRPSASLRILHEESRQLMESKRSDPLGKLRAGSSLPRAPQDYGRGTVNEPLPNLLGGRDLPDFP